MSQVYYCEEKAEEETIYYPTPASAANKGGTCKRTPSSPPSSPGGTLSTGTLSSCITSFSYSSTARASSPANIPPCLSPVSGDDNTTVGMVIHNHRNKFSFNKGKDAETPSPYGEFTKNVRIENASKNSSKNNNTNHPTMRDNNDVGGTKVWVKKAAVESVRNPRLSFKEKMSRKPSVVSSSFNSGSLHGSFSNNFSRQASFVSGSNGSVASFSSQRDLFGDSDSDIGSIGVTPFMQSDNRSGEWGWTSAFMIDSSDGNITLQLDDAPVNSSSSDTSSDLLSNSSTGISSSNNSSNEQIIKLPASAISDGDIVMANEYELSNEGNKICPDDLISLSHLHEPAVVECLQQRYDDDKIYTATGPVLLALNPFQNVPGLYGEATMKRYWEKAENQSKVFLPPHVYAIADEAFRSMMRSLEQALGEATTVRTSCDQSILVSGESGAGKTVTTKFVMKYLAALSQRVGSEPKEKRAYEKVADERKKRSGSSSDAGTSRTQMTPSWVSRSKRSDIAFSDGASRFGSSNNKINIGNKINDGLSNVTYLVGDATSNSIEAQVLQSNPILESFGNARTMRNDNSSRFGKFIEIQFTRSGRLVGAQIDTYLLEKVRLVTQSIGERNYHIFYEMLSGSIGAEELRNYFIASTASPDDFRITASGTLDRRDGVSDKDTCRALQSAMKTMKFSAEEQRDVFAAAAAILHASNLTFCDLDEYCSLDARNVHLEPVCHLLGVTIEDLNQALCHFSITAGRDTHVKQNLDIDKAEKGLEALLKATYGALFTYLVTKINDSICYSADGDDTHPNDTPCASIGVLDIFGFESFKTNSFEQLCINYCNETLQQQFNAFVLKNEQAEYEREGIEWSFIEFPENQDVIDLIDKRGSGILCILDDQCRAPGTSDKSFALDVYNKCKNQARLSANRKQTAVLQFCVHHYAGPVEYSTNGFLEKNRDELPKEATELLQNSFNPFIRLLSSTIEKSCSEGSSNTNSKAHIPRRQESSSFGRTTVGGQFRRQLKCLREKIDVMSPHYVRCLKPNDELVPNHFDKAAVAEQLRCGGILEAVRVARAGYSNHYSHDEFLRRYKCLDSEALKAPKPQDRVGGSLQPRKKFFQTSSQNYLSNNSETSSVGNSAACDHPYAASGFTSCKTLVKHLCRLLQQGQNYENNENKNNSNTLTAPEVSSPLPQVKSYAYKTSSPPPSWAMGGSGSVKKSNNNGLPLDSISPSTQTKPTSIWDRKTATSFRPPATPEIKRRSISKNSCGITSESAKIGIQIGKSKVFLRHKAFESLERLRSQKQFGAAVKINSVCRMFLARVAYVHVRNAVRKSMLDLQAYQNDEWKESKKNDSEDQRLVEFFNRLDKMRHSFNGQSFSLVEVWASQMRESIHNPKPRSEWGKYSPPRPFVWMLVDGLWTKNHEI